MPSSGVQAVAFNVTVVEPTAGGYLAVYPAGGPQPYVSNLNFVANQTVPNSVIAGIGAGGQIAIYNPAGTVHVLVDAAGWFGGQPLYAGGALACPVAPPPPPTPVDPPPETPPAGRIVTAGAFCKNDEVGAIGHTATGVQMICTKLAGETTPRWRAG